MLQKKKGKLLINVFDVKDYLITSAINNIYDCGNTYYSRLSFINRNKNYLKLLLAIFFMRTN